MTDVQDMQFIDERERELYARAQLSEDVRAFLQSSTGRYLHGRAKAEIERCQVEALTCDPGFSLFGWGRGRRKLLRLRQEAAVADKFIVWCAEALVDGENAYVELKEYREPQK